MKKLLYLFFLLILVPACSSKLFRPVDIGKTFGLTTPSKVPIYREPRLDSEVFYLDDVEVFETLEAVCEGGKGWWSDCVPFILSDFAEAKRGFFKVRFDSGEEGYMNFTYFFPKHSPYILSEYLVKRYRGKTVREYVPEMRKELEELRKKYDAEWEDAMRKNEEIIMNKPWPERIKELVIKGRVEIGMTVEQVLLAHNPIDIPSFKKKQRKIEKLYGETLAAEGVTERWASEKRVYYFLNGKLVRMETLPMNPSSEEGR